MRALEYLRDDPHYSVTMNHYRQRCSQQDGIALRRSDMISDTEWERTVEYQVVYRTVGVEKSLWCFRALPEAASAAIITRAKGRPEFREREMAIAHTLMVYLTPLIGGALTRFSEPSAANLPPRVQDVLRCILDGDSDKPIASRLGISRYTVNEYTKYLYRYFGVQGRTGLMAGWLKRGWNGSRTS